MGIALKCDRCGKLFEPYMLNQANKALNYASLTKRTNHLDSCISDDRGHYDLCASCRRSFEKWIKMESAVEQPKKGKKIKITKIPNDADLRTVKVPTMVTVQEASERTGLTARIIREYIKEDRIVYITVGRKILVNLDKLIELLNSGWEE